MKRIAFIDEDTGCAGATVSLVYIVRRFVRDGYEVSVYTQKPPELLALYHDIGARTIPYKFSRFTNLCLNLYLTNVGTFKSFANFSGLIKDAVKFFVGIAYFFRMFKDSRPDFVYANEYVILQALVAARMLRIPCGVHIRSNMLTGSLGIRRRTSTWLIGRITDLIVPITAVEGQQLRLSPAMEAKIHVVGEFLDEGNYTLPDDAAAPGSQRGGDAAKKCVVMLGGISSIKGTIEFLNAARLILARRRDIRFVVAGKANTAEPEYCQRCMELLRSEELSQNVLLTGEIARVTPLIGSADLLVSANTMSHFSRPVIEAWALHKPVVSSATRHAKNLIDDGVDGLLADVNDPIAFSEAMVRVLDDPGLASALGERGYAKARAQYDAGANTGRIVGYVAACLEAKNRGRG